MGKYAILVEVHELRCGRQSSSRISTSYARKKLKRQLARRECLRQMQHRAGILSDGIQHHRIARLGNGFAQDLDRLGLEAAQADVVLSLVHS
jgi:hypothetical protein